MKAFKNTTKLLKALTYNLKSRTVNTIETIENNLKEHQEKIKKQLNSDKALDQKIK